MVRGIQYIRTQEGSRMMWYIFITIVIIQIIKLHATILSFWGHDKSIEAYAE